MWGISVKIFNNSVFLEDTCSILFIVSVIVTHQISGLTLQTMQLKRIYPLNKKGPFILVGICFFLSGCQILGPESDIEQSALFPARVVTEFEVCCRVKFENSCPAAIWPGWINTGREGQYIITDGRTLWSYERSGKLVSEKKPFGDISYSSCWITRTESGFAYTCEHNGNKTYAEVDDRGEVVFSFDLVFSNQDEELIPVAGEGPLYLASNLRDVQSYVAKLDRQGGLEWELNFPETYLERVLPLENGHVLMGGFTLDSTKVLSSGSFERTAVQMGYEPPGRLLWEKQPNCDACRLSPFKGLGENQVLWEGSRSESYVYGSNSGTRIVDWFTVTNWEGETAMDFLDQSMMGLLSSKDIVMVEMSGEGLNLAVRTRERFQTVRIGSEGGVVDTYNWPLFRDESCRMRDIIQNDNGELVALLSCGGIQSCKRTSGEDWAMIKVLN